MKDYRLLLIGATLGLIWVGGVLLMTWMVL